VFLRYTNALDDFWKHFAVTAMLSERYEVHDSRIWQGSLCVIIISDFPKSTISLIALAVSSLFQFACCCSVIAVAV